MCEEESGVARECDWTMLEGHAEEDGMCRIDFDGAACVEEVGLGVRSRYLSSGRG